MSLYNIQLFPVSKVDTVDGMKLSKVWYGMVSKKGMTLHPKQGNPGTGLTQVGPHSLRNSATCPEPQFIRVAFELYLQLLLAHWAYRCKGWNRLKSQPGLGPDLKAPDLVVPDLGVFGQMGQGHATGCVCESHETSHLLLQFFDGSLHPLFGVPPKTPQVPLVSSQRLGCPLGPLLQLWQQASHLGAVQSNVILEG